MKQSNPILRLKKTVRKTASTMGRFFEQLYQKFNYAAETKPFLTILLLSFGLNLVIEILSRHSLLDACAFLVLHPYIFLFNTFALFVSFSLSLLFARRAFVLTILTVVWFLLGLTNCILLSLRTTPFAAIDFSLLVSCLSIITIYLSILHIILIVLGLVALIVALVFVFRKTKKLTAPRFSRLRGAMASLCSVAVFCLVVFFSIKIDAIETDFTNLKTAYNDYGFVYCFSLSVLDRGIDRPDDYSDESINEILSSIQENLEQKENQTDIPPAQSSALPEKPNIIFVQLESFFDVNRLRGISFTENPLPIFTALKDTCSWGMLSVPSLGGGTANTEFEVLTGMNLNNFGAGEYPYKTILNESTCESTAYNLRSLGYTAHALHNNSATFYNRHKVYSSLGFDVFIPLELMQNVEYNPLGWAKDIVLTEEIMACLANTESQDFVFAVSVQPHGKYPDNDTSDIRTDTYESESFFERLFGSEDESDDNPGGHLTGNPDTDLTEEELRAQRIKVSGIDNKKLTAQYTYYVNQLYETDRFIGQLITALSSYEEPTVLVLYGDHLPSFEYTEESFDDDSTPFETEYVIWSNFEMARVEKDLHTYQLSAEVLGRFDIHEGIITALHHTQAAAPSYLNKLELVSYDMLYGDMEVWNGINPHLPTDLQIGLKPISIEGLKVIDQNLYVLGENFTPFSSVLINGKNMETVFINAATLLVSKPDLKHDNMISVIQAGADRVVLCESNTVIWNGTIEVGTDAAAEAVTNTVP
ncbi:MAG: sulfatase-like hydrolase/transferase [Clostridia bacterium]|nr:sulfatase-like hydrolase/transferase [Clostridia bacterium]